MFKRMLYSVFAVLCLAGFVPSVVHAQRYGVSLVPTGYSNAAGTTYAIGDLVSSTSGGITSYYVSLACQGASTCPTYTTVQPLTVAAAWGNLGAAASGTPTAPRTNATSTDSITSADFSLAGGYVSETYAGAVAVSLPAIGSSAPSNGSKVTIKSLGGVTSGVASTMTIAPPSGTLIDGNASLSVIYPGDVTIEVDGTNYKVSRGSGDAGATSLTTPFAFVAVGANPGAVAQAPCSTTNGTYVEVEAVTGGATTAPTCQPLTPALVGADAAGAATAVAAGGPLAPVPVLTSTANTNRLPYSGQLASQWPGTNLAALTGGQSDENGNATASLVIPNTTAAVNHGISQTFSLLSTTSQTISVSVYVKQSGTYFTYADVGLLGAGLPYDDNYFNMATCAVVGPYLQPSTGGPTYTLAAAAAGNGYCLLTVTFTTPANSRIMWLYIDPTTISTGNPRDAGDGVSGMYVSHPQLSVTATPVTYQNVTGTIRYCVAEYNASGQTGGCSPYAKAGITTIAAPTNFVNSENNTIATTSVAGCNYEKIFRTGGNSQGALIVSGTTQLACGATVTDSGLTADGTTIPTATALISTATQATDIRQADVTSLEYFQAEPYTTVRIFSAEPGLAGTIGTIHVTMNNSVDMENSYLLFTCNGAATPQKVNIGMFFLLQDYPVPFSTNYRSIIATLGSSGAAQGNNGFPIPFSNGCNVDFLNGSTQQTFFSEVYYKVGALPPDPLCKSWHAYSTPLTAIAAYQQVNLLPLTALSGGGELQSLTLYVNSTASYGYFEGNPTVFCDGIVCSTANGGEDYVGGGDFFGSTTTGGLVSLQSDKWGDFVGSGLTSPAGAYDSLIYRNYIRPEDKLIANSSLQFLWSAGQVGEGFAAVTYKSLVTWCTAN